MVRRSFSSAQRAIRGAGFSLALVLLVAPIALCVVYVALYGVNVPYVDDWTVVPLVAEWRSGSIDLAELWSDDTGHRLVVPKLVTLATASYGRWNVRHEMFAGLAVLIAAGLLVLRAMATTLALDRRSASVFVVLPAVLLWFSLRQWETLLHGFSMTHTLCSGFVVVAICCVASSCRPAGAARNLHFAAAVSFAALGSFSMLMGLLIWPIGLIMLAVRGERRLVAVWATVAALVLAGYIYGLELRAPMSAGLEDVLVYALTMLGASVALSQSAISHTSSRFDFVQMFLLGVSLLAVAVYAVWQVRWRGAWTESLPWIGMVLYGAGAAIMTGVGRTELGLQNAAASRYTPHTIPFVVGTYALLVLVARRGARAAESITGGVAAVMAVAAVLAAFSELQVGPYRRALLESWADTVRNYRDRVDAVLEFPDERFPGSLLRSRAETLDRLDLSVFSASAATNTD